MFLEVTKTCKAKLKNRTKVYAKLLVSLSKEDQSYANIAHLE
jgi:hypothetical protein